MAGEKLVNLPIILFQYSLFNIQNNHNENRTSTNEQQYIQTKQTTGGSREKIKKLMNIRRIAEEVFEIESKEIANLSRLLTIDFENAVKSIINSKGKLIISGMGKSGIVGKKIAATLASTGTPSFFYIRVKHTMEILEWLKKRT